MMLLIAAGSTLYHYKKDSADGRLLIWRVAADMALEKPFVGYGINGFADHYMSFQERYFSKNPDTPFAQLADENVYAFNEPLRIYVEQGVAGLLLFSFLIFSVFRLAVKSNLRNKLPDINVFPVSAAVLCTLFVFGCFSYPLAIFPLKFLTVFFAAIAASYGKPIVRNNYSPFVTQRLLPFVTIFAGIFIMATYIGYVSPNVIAYRAWNNALREYNFNKTNAVHSIKQVFPHLDHNKVFLITYGKAMNGAGLYDEAIKALERADSLAPSYAGLLETGISYENSGKYDKAEHAWQRASRMIPSRFMPGYLQLKMYRAKGDTVKARKMAEVLLTKKVKTDSPDLDAMMYEIKTLYPDINSIH